MCDTIFQVLKLCFVIQLRGFLLTDWTISYRLVSQNVLCGSGVSESTSGLTEYVGS